MIAPAQRRFELTNVDWSRIATATGECANPNCGNALLRSERRFCSHCLELARRVLDCELPATALVRA